MAILYFFLSIFIAFPCLADSGDDLFFKVSWTTKIIYVAAVVLSIVSVWLIVSYFEKRAAKDFADKKPTFPLNDLPPANCGIAINQHNLNSLLFCELISILLNWARLGLIRFEFSGFSTSIVKTNDWGLTSCKYEEDLFGSLFNQSDKISLVKTVRVWQCIVKTELVDVVKEPNPFNLAGALSCLIICIYSFIIIVVANKTSGSLEIDVIMAIVLLVVTSLVAYTTSSRKLGDLMSPENLEIYRIKYYIQGLTVDEIKSQISNDPQFFEKVLPYATAMQLGWKFIRKCNGIVTNYPEWFYRGQQVTEFCGSYKRVWIYYYWWLGLICATVAMPIVVIAIARFIVW